MCVAIPGKVIEINGNIGRVSFGGNVVPVELGLVGARVDDYVIVHAGLALEVLSEDKAKDMIELFAELEALLND